MAGWNRSSGAAQPTPKKPSALRGVIAGVVCVAIAAAVAFFVMSGKDAKPKAKVEKDTGLIKEVKPAAAPKAQPQQEKVDDKVVKPVKKGEPVSVEKLANGDEIWVMPDGRRRLVVDHYKLKEGEEPRKPLFKHHLENVLALFAVPGVEVPPIPDLFTDEEIQAALNDPIVVDFENEDESTIEKRLAVSKLKEDMKAYIKEGGSAREYIAALEQEQQKTAETVKMATDMIRASLREGNIDEAKEFHQRVDAMLKEKGLPGLWLNGYMRYRLGLNKRGEIK